MLKYQRRIGDGTSDLNNTNVQVGLPQGNASAGLPGSSRMQERKVNGGYLWPQVGENNMTGGTTQPSEMSTCQNFVGAYGNS